MLSQSFLVSVVVPFAVSPALTGVILILLRARSISTCTSTPAFLAAFKARVTSASLNVHGPLPKTHTHTTAPALDGAAVSFIARPGVHIVQAVTERAERRLAVFAVDQN